MTNRPAFSSLDRPEIDAVLARHHVGRLAYSRRDRVDIEPIHFVYADGWIYVRTQPGTKLATIAHNPWVAMEVDEIESLFHWESVVLRGRLEVLDDGPHSAAVERHAKALEALRQLIPETLTEHDPTPDRTVLCAIYLDEVEGRRARPGTGT